MAKKWKEVEVEIDLGDFSNEEIAREAENRNLKIPDGTFDSVEHLIVCGQVEHAKTEALEIVSKIIGMQFK